MKNEFNTSFELDRLKALQKIGQRRPYRKSKLSKHRAELVKLHKAGASLRHIPTWLHYYKKIKVARSTIMRYLKKFIQWEQKGIINHY